MALSKMSRVLREPAQVKRARGWPLSLSLSFLNIILFNLNVSAAVNVHVVYADMSLISLNCGWCYVYNRSTLLPSWVRVMCLLFLPCLFVAYTYVESSTL